MDLAYLATQYSDAEKLRTRIEAHARYSEQTQDFHSWLLPHLDATPGMTVLDAGCGSGAYHPYLAALGVRIVAADMSPGMIREVRTQAIGQSLHVDALTGDAQRLPFRGNSFGRVMANHMLYHVPDQALALREIRRVLRPGSAPSSRRTPRTSAPSTRCTKPRRGPRG
jgi:ubiquinone/menaquinone biosynthesis C-methylase UbiE